MTEQVPDYFTFRDRRFIIIDIEYGTRPQEEFIQIPDDFRHSTAGYRGYQAKYRIIDGRLTGHQIFDDGISPDTPLQYTGTMLIARKADDFWITDFLMCYLDADEAYELRFKDGILTETRDLADAIAEARTIRESEWWRSDLVSPAEKRETMDEFCRAHLRSPYDYRTYRWLTDSNTGEDAHVTTYFRNLEERRRKREEDCAEVQKLCSYLPLLRELKGNYLMKNPDGEDSYYEVIPKDKEAERKCREFLETGYNSSFWDREYTIHVVPLLDYYPDREEAQLHANREEICALLTLELRTDYWCDGAFDDQIEDGTYIPLLENLSRIIDETYHPWKKTELRTGDARFAGMKNRNRDETLPPDVPADESVLTARQQMGTVLRIIDETYIAGSSYIGMDEMEYGRRFRENKPLSLVLEPDNQYDRKAVRIEDAEHVKLGYLPRSVNDIPYRLLYGGYRLFAYPLGICTGAKGKSYSICVVMDLAEDI